MTPQPIIPEPLYIEDASERVMNLIVDALFEKLIKEVEEEEQAKNVP